MRRSIRVLALASLATMLLAAPTAAAQPEMERIPVEDVFVDDFLSEVCGTEVVTVEVFAAWIHDRLAKPLGGDGAEVVAVRVWESGDAFGGIRATV